MGEILAMTFPRNAWLRENYLTSHKVRQFQVNHKSLGKVLAKISPILTIFNYHQNKQNCEQLYTVHEQSGMTGSAN